jgi:hypothetical protein
MIGLMERISQKRCPQEWKSRRRSVKDRRELEVAEKMQQRTFHMVPLLSTDTGSIGLVFHVRQICSEYAQ